MTCGLSKVRRLSMGNTTWVWYWKEAEGKWREYEISDGLERRYLAGEKTLAFTIGIHQYELRFSDMVQKNISTKMERQVRRRPLLQNAPNGIPTYWDPNLLPSVGYEKIKLKRSSEYSTILSLFDRTMQGPRWDILNIERIQNLLLWNFFTLQKHDMKAKTGKDVDERFLFHGTDSKHVDAICSGNIDWRMCGKNGTSYGEGSYFASDAKYSSSFTSKLGPKSMFVCRVLVGDFTKGERNYKKPPLKDEHQNIPFDSCVNDPDNPSIFVIFEKSQIYPQYLIQYLDLKEKMNPELDISSLIRPSVPANASQLPSPAVAASGVLSSSDASKSTATVTLPSAGPSGTVQLAPQMGQREAFSDSFDFSSVSNKNSAASHVLPPPPHPQLIPTTDKAFDDFSCFIKCTSVAFSCCGSQEWESIDVFLFSR
ncbi:protein mono-ADP-ribosyltransferase PARP12-like [Engraulis encrasicolus]|uniref:protein mono-ADP-ribosyltransferase PARP12-like n=1 Tax=Engraulis encrasicolus TaxID=184585 RepID=UPI002FD1A069